MRQSVKGDALIVSMYRETQDFEACRDAYGLCDSTFLQILFKNGIRQPRNSTRRTKLNDILGPLAERVKNGESIRKSAMSVRGDRYFYHQLMSYCKENGIKSKARCRWRAQ